MKLPSAMGTTPRHASIFKSPLLSPTPALFAVDGSSRPWARSVAMCSAGLILAGLISGCGGSDNDTAQVDTTPPPVISAERAAALSVDLQAVVDTPSKNLASLAVVAVKGGQLAYQGSFGSRQIDNTDPSKSLPANDQTKYRIASISKTVTAIAVMQLVERGQINLDADASSYLPFTLRNPAFPSAMITPAMLLSHTGSIRDDEGYNLSVTQAISSYFIPGGTNYGSGGAWGSRSPADNYFVYTNLNYGLLASMVEHVTGKRFDVYAKENIFDPLGVKASFNPQHFADADFTNIATLYRKRTGSAWDPAGPWVPQWDNFGGVRPTVSPGDAALLASYVPGTNGTLFGPQGGLRISALDLSKIMRLLMGGGEVDGVRILQKPTVDSMFTPRWTYTATPSNGNNYYGLFRSWGLGVQLFTATEDAGTGDKITQTGSLKWAGHLGDAYGLFSGMVFDPATGNGMIYIIGGVGANPDSAALGQYSTFYRWEEQILSATYQRVFGTP